MVRDPFLLPDESYVRDLNVFDNYIKDASNFLHRQTNQPMETCVAFVKKRLKATVRNPIITHTLRQENGDRVEMQTGLMQYLGESIKNEETIAPTLTTYLSPKVERSFQTVFVDGNKARRKVVKHKQGLAEMAGDQTAVAVNKATQTNIKQGNNSLSGAYISASTPMFNKTAHPTLTSTCRMTSGHGNANNEKLLAGNRHYWHRDIVINNIASIIRNTDYTQLKHTMESFGLYYPTVDDTMDCITRSTNLYWRTHGQLKTIRAIVSKLDDLERAAFVYTGDLYQLAKYNPAVVKKFFDGLSKECVEVHLDPDAVFKAATDDYKYLAIQIHEREARGFSYDDIIKENRPLFGKICSTIENVQNVVEEHYDFIKTFLTTYNLPASVAKLPSSIRRIVLVSDTDSTIFTVDNWVEWYFGENRSGAKENAIAAVVVFLSSQNIAHVLSIMSANLGIELKRLHDIYMKNEFKFDGFAVTNEAKHYYALIGCKEGNLYKSYKKEQKGVHLKSANTPAYVLKDAQSLMTEILETVNANKLLVLKELMTRIGTMERKVYDSIKYGNDEFFRSLEIKPANTYKKGPSESNYIHYTFWNEVFGPKYGMIKEPPFAAIKINSTTDTANRFYTWVSEMKDPELKARFMEWIKRNPNRKITTFYLPKEIVTVHGIPDEIQEMMNTRKMVKDICGIYYLILETLGIYITNDKYTRLVMDTH